jgi:peptidoglycan hydrolase-like protein with peptidoglycan-binding domain
MASRPWSSADGSGESELWRRYRGFRRFGRPYRFGRFVGRRRWAPWGRVWGGAFLPAPALPVAPPPVVAAPDAGSSDSGDSSSDSSEEFALQGEVLPENENEYWRRRAWRGRRFGRPFRRRRFLKWRRRMRMGGGGMLGGGGSFSQSDDSDSGDSGDDSDSGELSMTGEAPGETESEFRAYRGYRPVGYRGGVGYGGGVGFRGGVRYPAYRYRGGWARPAVGLARPWVGRRYPYFRRPLFGVRSPLVGRGYYAGRAWPSRRFYGGRWYSPLAYRRWPWLRRRVFGYRPPLLAAPAGVPALPPPPLPVAGGEAPGSPWILLVQGCLRKLLGPGATPVDGVLGPQTQSALRAFQQQNGLPPTGGLDNATVQALQGACMGSAGAPPAGAEPPSPPPPDGGPQGAEPPAGAAPGGDQPPDGGAPPPEGAAPDGAGGPPPPEGAAPQGEITLGRHEGESEQEFLVDGPARIDVERHDPVPLDGDPEFNWAPDAPGLYVIYVGGKPWYVGIAERSIRKRFLQRRKALNDLQIPASAMAGRTVGWYLLRYSAVPRGAIQRREQGNLRAPFRPVTGTYSILRILEQVYIKRLRNPSGNQLVESVQFGPKGSLVITENGARVSEFQPNSRV